MASIDDDFQARIKRVRAQSGRAEPKAARARADDGDFDERALIATILRPQIALILGAFALIAGRAIAINQLGIEPGLNQLSLAEGAVILPFLIIFGLLIGRSEYISHGALIVGAAVAFLCEAFYFPVAPGVMSSVYGEAYVSLVILSAG